MCDSRAMDELLTITEAAERLSMHRATVYRMIADGLLTPVRVPRPSRRGTVPRLRATDVDRLRRSS
jgi:excisionase family DNA binding protein